MSEDQAASHELVNAYFPGSHPRRTSARRARPVSWATAEFRSGTDVELGKEAVFRELFDEYWLRVRRHFDCYIDNCDEVDELTAEVFLAAWRKLNPARPMPLAWFLRTANNKLRDRTRRTRSRERAMQALVRGLDAPTHSLCPLEALALRNAIRELSAREQQVVVLTYWDELSAGEVASVLRTSQGAVWTTLTRARTKLRIQLEGGVRER